MKTEESLPKTITLKALLLQQQSQHNGQEMLNISQQHLQNGLFALMSHKLWDHQAKKKNTKTFKS